MEEQIAELVKREYGFQGAFERLDGERDWNFQVVCPNDDRRYVLKVFAPAESEAFVDAEVAVHQWLEQSDLPLPRVQKTLTGRTTCLLDDGTQPRLARMVTKLEGTVLAQCQTFTDGFWHHFGELIGRLQTGLSRFDHPGIHREFAWDLAKANEPISTSLAHIADRSWREVIETVVRQHEAAIHSMKSPLPCGAIHNDLNDWNVLCAAECQPVSAYSRVSGIFDFGDMLWSDRVNDLAIAIAYAVLSRPDPAQIALEIATGYLGVEPLTDDELRMLWHRVRLRLALSSIMAHRQAAADPSNEYLLISQKGIRETLPELLRIPAGYIECSIRQRAGLPLPRRVESTRQWLNANRMDFPFPLEGLSNTSAMVLDWSIATPLFAGDTRKLPRVLEDRTEQQMIQSGMSVAFGRWCEPRLVYQADQFQSRSEKTPRTVHLGIDLFAAAGTTVVASDHGVIVHRGVIHRPLDYGGLLIVEYKTTDGEAVRVLYGHLEPASIEDWRPGDRITRGERIARLGDRSNNGGWLPHLHLQIILEDFGLGQEFPGVCRADQLAVWSLVSPNPAALVGLDDAALDGSPANTKSLIAERQARIGRSVRLSYASPLQLVRGIGQYLFDEWGRRYLDAYNNVPHVGHGNTEVADAADRQMRLLNTNTRYVSELQVEFARQLADTMPPGLEICYFLNSASEANELALRIARCATGGLDMIVNEDAYHGHTTSLIDISPYKHNSPGGSGPPDWVHAIPLPDTYRGPYRGNDKDVGGRYAEHVNAALSRIEARGGRLAGFIAETCPSVGGQIVPPASYLGEVYQRVRAAGGVCIADEVQTGYGRMGDNFYAFERSRVVPDMVILGKPIGNGYPLAALVTTRVLADTFNNGLEFFSTFGGSHVSCAVGLKVLEIVRREKMQEHAQRVGSEMLDAFRNDFGDHPLVGDIRGSGFFQGIELIRNRDTLEPATAEAGWIKNRLRHDGFLIGTDGPFDNVLKIRPPMVFDRENAIALSQAIKRALASLHRQ